MSSAGKGVALEAFLGGILDCVAQPVWVVDRDGVILFANPAATDALGYDRPEDLLGKPSHETIHYKHRDGSFFPVEECPMLRPRQTGETISNDEDWFVRADGSMLPVAYISAPLEIESGRGAVVAFTDIEERRKHEQSLRERDVILESLAQPVFMTEKGVIQYVNPAAVDVLGFDDASEIVGQVGHWLVHYKRPDGSQYPIEECPLWQAGMKGERLRDGEDTWFRKDGSMMPVAYSAVPLERPGGVGMVVAFDDISERLAAEHAERERDIAETRAIELAAARRRVIEAADAERQRVTRDLHDGAQQDLVAVITNLQLARQSWAEPGAQELVESALAAADRGLRGVRELAAGIHPAILTTRGLAAALESLPHRMPVPVEFVELPSGRLPTRIEANVYFLVSEALTNVAKHARASRATVSVVVRGDQLAIEVSDDGVGGASLDAAGSGLPGLADRVAALDGRFELRSVAGAGTTMHATIPVEAASQGASEGSSRADK
jgi:PAS domain S-box-containing protein